MTLSFAERSPSAAVRTGAPTGSLSPTILTLTGALLCFALSWSSAAAIWHTGTYADTDDAMRMVQVRAWMAGQGWFDLAAHRLDPPQGVFMHWSRVVDVPLAILIRGFELVTTQAQAESLARLVFPLGLQAGFVAAMIFTGRVLCGPAGGLPAMVLAVTSCIEFGQFVPGRIDHHAPQITLLVLMTGCAADAILRGRRNAALWSAVLIAVSLAISLENLPFIAVIITALALSWAAQGEARGAMLRGFGIGLAVAVAVVFAATVAPWRYGIVTPDALSLPHLLACLMGGTALALLPSLETWARTPVRRTIVAAAAGLLVAGFVVALCPGVLSSPYAQLDAVVRSVWLARVTEALPLTTAVRLHPQAATLIVAPLLVGLTGGIVASFVEQGVRRGVWIVVSTLTLVGLAGAMWEVRVVSSATPLGLLAGVWAYATLTRPVSGEKPALIDALRAALALLLFAPMAWVIVPTPEESPTTSKAAQDAEACRSPDHLTPLAALAPGTMFASIDSGSHLLVHTGLSVIGAPYHRNNHGNRAIIDGFSAEGDDAKRIVGATGARYVALCPGQVQAEALTKRNPNGLAAQILAGRAPAWLEKIELPGTPYLVFAVRSAG